MRNELIGYVFKKEVDKESKEEASRQAGHPHSPAFGQSHRQP